MSTLYSCDPGFSKTNATGRAEFVDGQLVACAALQPKAESYIERIEEIVLWMCAPQCLTTAPDILVVENPKIYPGPQQKGDPDDVVLLATLAGMIAGRVPHKLLKLPRPQEWKGNVPKDIMFKRIWDRLLPLEKDQLDLSAREIAVLETPGKMPAAKVGAKLDAIGCGLVELGRLGR